MRSQPCQGQIAHLTDLEPGQKATIVGVEGDPSLKCRLGALGILKGTEVMLDYIAPLGSPRIYSVLGYRISLRNRDAEHIVLCLHDDERGNLLPI